MKTSKLWITTVLSLGLLCIPVVIISNAGDAGWGGPFFVLTGRLFESGRPILMGGALDQPSLHKVFFILCFSSLVVIPPLIVVRIINKRREYWVRRVFASVSLTLLFHPLSVLICFTYEGGRYINRMGWTPERIKGLSVGLFGFVLFGVIAYWLWHVQDAKPES